MTPDHLYPRAVSAADLAFLVVAGIGAGLTGSVAGLASLVSYPALLLVGLSPVAANMTNTVALTGTTVGAVAGSRPELQGQKRAVLRLSVLTALGGALGGVLGGVLLLVTPARTFAAVVPWLVAAASVLLVVGPGLRRMCAHRVEGPGAGTAVAAMVFAVGVYGGYFGAAAGVIMLALLSAVWAQSLARTNAAKNVVTGAANVVAALVFAVTGPVSWSAAAALGAGSLAGARLGPVVVRRLPATPLRVAISLCGLVLAAWLAWRPAN